MKQIAALALAVTISGCALTPVPATRIHDDTIRHRPDTSIWQPYSEMDPVLECIGDQLRENKVGEISLGYNVVDTTGKTGVDVGMLTLAALQKIAARGNGLIVSSFGTGPVPDKLIQISQQDIFLLQSNLPFVQQQRIPAWTVQGGVTSVEGAFLQRQNSWGVGGRDLDVSRSASNTVSVVDLTFSLKQTKTALNFPGATVSLRVAWQTTSGALEAGAFVAARVDGRKIGAGLRLGRSSAVSQLAVDALRVGTEAGVAFLLAQQLNLNLPICAERAGEYSVQGKKITHVHDLPDQFNAMTDQDQVMMVQRKLQERGYDPGPADGLLGDLTRSALRRFQADNGAFPDGKLSPTTMAMLARTTKKPIQRGKGALKILLRNQPFYPAYQTGMKLEALVSVPVSGHLWCWMRSPTKLEAIFPVWPERSNWVSGHAAAEVPGASGLDRQPVIRLDEPGLHEIYCAQTAGDITDRLPRNLKIQMSSSHMNSGGVIEAVKGVAGAGWIGDGRVNFEVTAPGQEVPQQDQLRLPANIKRTEDLGCFNCLGCSNC